MVKNYVKFLLTLVALHIQVMANAQGESVLSATVHRAHGAGTSFQPVTLFRNTTGSKHDILKNENLLTEDRAEVETLYGKKPKAISISFTDQASNKTYTLEMLRSNPVAQDANFGYIENGFRYRTGFTDGVHYQGAVVGSEKSLATMSVFADGTVMALFANEDGNFVVGKVEDGSGNYVFYNDKDMLAHPFGPCETKEAPNAVNGGPSGLTGPNLCHKVQVYWEGDYQYFQSRSSNMASAISYMTGLFNQFQAMYRNETISVELKSLYIWITDDAYPNTTSSVGLDMFKGYWNGRGDAFDGDIAHFITRDAHNNGGLAYVNVLNNRGYAYAYSEITGTYNTVPTYSWDVMVLTHETGHNMGSNHTHWCGWMTGPGGTCGSIDNCRTPKDASASCATCSYQTWDNALPAASWSGTVMSYCHLVARGISLANGFGPLPGNAIRTGVNGAPLKSVIAATLTPATICSSDGAVTLNFDANNFGVTPYQYNWSNGATTQNITGLSTAGSYTVTVTDSNGCANSFSANVTKYARPGDGKATGYTKPICCDAGPVSLTITTNVPTDLNSCQTVAWLRTNASIGTFLAAQSAFAIATPADIIPATNTASVTNGTAATLTVSSPTPCVAQSYYYTPFVSRKIRSAINIPSTVSNTGAVMQNSTTIGAYAALPDQTGGGFSPCDVNDTPTTKSIAVTVSSYTGRANKMTMLLYDQNNTVIYRSDGLAGNGTYTIPLTNVSNPIQYMEVHVFDFNCTSSSSCTGSTASVSASRSVVYPAITQITMDKVCVAGQSISLGFAPTNCDKLGGGNNNAVNMVNADKPFVNVYPNPATKSVTVQFYGNSSGNAVIKVSDMLGKLVHEQGYAYSTGDNLIQVDVHNWAKGVYSLSFNDGVTPVQNIKLVVQ